MKILTRYMLRVHLAPFVFALFALTGLLFVNTVARLFPSMAGKGLPTSIILRLCWLSLPHILALTIPMAVLVAVLYAFSQLTADNEITALKASGVNLVRLVLPLLGGGFVLAAFMLYFNDQILPETNHQLKILQLDVGRKSPTVSFEEQVINKIEAQNGATYYLQASHIDRKTNKLRDVVIYDMSNAGRVRTVYADSGRMAFNRKQTDLFLKLYDGRVSEVKDAEPQSFQRVFFKEQMLMMPGIANTFEHSQDEYRSDREMGLAMLSAEADSAHRELARVRQEARRLSLMEVEGVTKAASLGESQSRLNQFAGEMKMLAAQAEAAQERADQFTVEWHKKWAIPFACIVFVLIGAPLAIRFPRGGPGMVIAISLAIFGIYYMSLIGGESLGDKGKIAPFWGPWAPNLIFLGLAVWGLAGIGRETATTRGGGWADLGNTLAAILTPWKRRRR